MELDATLLSRIQFGFTLAFHILFPTLTIGLSVFLVIFEGNWLWTGREDYLRLYRFWMKIFALAFGMGVVSGIVLSFEFGTNFSRFSAATGNVLGPLLGYEVLMAFFLEASFLPIMLFGWGRVSPRLHFFSTVMVSLGTILSAFWILAANSWMQTPTGYILEGGVFAPADWWKIVFNPSFPYRLSHMLVAAMLSSAFVVAGVSAWHLLHGRHESPAGRAFSVALWWALLLAPLQVLIGDLHGLQVQRDQPMKVAAMEALWETRTNAPFVVFGVPDPSQERNHWALEIPSAGSLILQHDRNGRVLGLNEVAPADRPNVPIVFYSFRVMLAVGFVLVIVAVIGAYLRWRGRLFTRRWYLRTCILAAPLGFIAVIAGWLVAEVGRQPWVVQGLLRTAEAATPLPLASVAMSLFLFFVVYNLLLITFLYFAYRWLQQGPERELPEHVRSAPRTAWRVGV